jgi:hypothetical protein
VEAIEARAAIDGGVGGDELTQNEARAAANAGMEIKASYKIVR